jgi:hypothetical protein
MRTLAQSDTRRPSIRVNYCLRGPTQQCWATAPKYGRTLTTPGSSRAQRCLVETRSPRAFSQRLKGRSTEYGPTFEPPFPGVGEAERPALPRHSQQVNLNGDPRSTAWSPEFEAAHDAVADGGVRKGKAASAWSPKLTVRDHGPERPDLGNRVSTICRWLGAFSMRHDAL